MRLSRETIHGSCCGNAVRFLVIFLCPSYHRNKAQKCPGLFATNFAALLTRQPVPAKPKFHKVCHSAEHSWKRLKGQNPERKNLRKLLRRKQSSAKIPKISRITLTSSKKSDIFYLLRNLPKYLLRTIFFFREVFRSFYPLRFYPLALFGILLGIVGSFVAGLWSFPGTCCGGLVGVQVRSHCAKYSELFQVGDDCLNPEQTHKHGRSVKR